MRRYWPRIKWLCVFLFVLALIENVFSSGAGGHGQFDVAGAIEKWNNKLEHELGTVDPFTLTDEIMRQFNASAPMLAIEPLHALGRAAGVTWKKGVIGKCYIVATLVGLLVVSCLIVAGAMRIGPWRLVPTDVLLYSFVIACFFIPLVLSVLSSAAKTLLIFTTRYLGRYIAVVVELAIVYGVPRLVEHYVVGKVLHPEGHVPSSRHAQVESTPAVERQVTQESRPPQASVATVPSRPPLKGAKKKGGRTSRKRRRRR